MGVPCRRSGGGFNGDPASLARDNMFVSIPLSVLSCLNCLTFDFDFWHEGCSLPWLGWECRSRSWVKGQTVIDVFCDLIFYPTCANARWALMHCFLSVRLTAWNCAPVQWVQCYLVDSQNALCTSKSYCAPCCTRKTFFCKTWGHPGYFFKFWRLTQNREITVWTLSVHDIRVTRTNDGHFI